MLDTFRAHDSAAFKYTCGNLERLYSAFRDHERARDCPVYPRNLELKSFLLAYHHISERVAANGMMSKYERTMLLVRTLPTRMRTKAVGKLGLDPLQPSTFRYAALHSWAVARIAAEENLELFELLDPDTTLPVLPAAATPAAAATTTATTTTNTPAIPAITDTPAATTATTTTTMTAATEPPTAPAATKPPAAATPAEPITITDTPATITTDTPAATTATTIATKQPAAPAIIDTPAEPTAAMISAATTTATYLYTTGTTATADSLAAMATAVITALPPAALAAPQVVSRVSHRVANSMQLPPIRRNRFIPSPGHHKRGFTAESTREPPQGRRSNPRPDTRILHGLVW